jgi:hypothetical protein
VRLAADAINKKTAFWQKKTAKLASLACRREKDAPVVPNG